MRDIGDQIYFTMKKSNKYERSSFQSQTWIHHVVEDGLRKQNGYGQTRIHSMIRWWR